MIVFIRHKDAPVVGLKIIQRRNYIGGDPEILTHTIEARNYVIV